MNITLKMKFNSPAGTVTKGGTFPLRGRTPEQVVYRWIQAIKREMYYEGLIEVIADGDQDITEKVKALLNE